MKRVSDLRMPRPHGSSNTALSMIETGAVGGLCSIRRTSTSSEANCASTFFCCRARYEAELSVKPST
ncbi:Uncharacterised protein [Bordetella pertussis]|nr:Uncharacterised protein [Bordetella pertussis]CPN40275.1 Uncharacterised protein [Bordetella pertussis]